MANIALICPPLPGHLNPIFAVGRALQLRGHRIIHFGIPAIEASVRAQRFDFEPVGSASSELLAESIRELAAAQGLRALRLAVEGARRITELLCEELPSAFTRAHVNCTLVDQNEPAGASVAEHLGIPFVSVCPSLPLNREPGIPPPFMPWSYGSDPWRRLRNRLGYGISDLLISPINRVLNRYRRDWGLKPISRPNETFSPLAQLSQMIPELDFPRRELPPPFHYLGPFLNPSQAPVAFPFEQLNGKRLIYASLGTLQARDSNYFQVIAESCAGLDAQLALSAGGDAGNLPQHLAGSPIVVRFAPQIEILSRASLTITHAGLNTVMQSLLCGVPMIALPITHDQPAIAARVARSGAGEMISMRKATPRSLRALVQRVLEGESYRTRARAMSKSIAQAGGVERAADIIESVCARH